MRDRSTGAAAASSMAISAYRARLQSKRSTRYEIRMRDVRCENPRMRVVYLGNKATRIPSRFRVISSSADVGQIDPSIHSIVRRPVSQSWQLAGNRIGLDGL